MTVGGSRSRRSTGLTSKSVLAVLEVLSLCREAAQGVRTRAERRAGQSRWDGPSILKDISPSRLKHGFESRWGHQPDFSGSFPTRILIPPCRDQNPHLAPRLVEDADDLL